MKDKTIKKLYEEFMKDYDPIKGIISLGQVNKFGVELIKEIANSEELKEIFKDTIRKEELEEHIRCLEKLKPSK